MFNLVKKSAAIMLCLAMVLSFAACGSKDPEETPSGNNGTQSNINLSEYDLDSEAVLNSMPADLKGTTIKFLNWYDPMQREEAAVIKAFEEKTGCKVEIIVKSYGAEYNEALASSVALGDAPDVIRMLAPSVANLKALQPISNTGFDFSDKAWDKDTQATYSVNDIVYGVNLKYSPFFLPSLLFYNTKTIEEYGIEDPYELWKEDKWTWDKLDEICGEWVKMSEKNMGVAVLPYGDAPAMTKGVDWISYDGSKYTVDLSNKTVLDAWTYSLEGKKNRIFCEPQDGFDTANQTTLFAAMDATAVQTSSQYYSKTRRRGNLGVVPYPVWTTKDEYYVPMMEDLAFGVPIGAKNAKAAPYFLSYYLDFSNYDTEGTNFFFSEQAKECYMEVMAMPKRFYNLSGDLMGSSGGYSGVMIFRTVDPAQLTPHLQEREYIINDRIAQVNDSLSKLDGQK